MEELFTSRGDPYFNDCCVGINGLDHTHTVVGLYHHSQRVDLSAVYLENSLNSLHVKSEKYSDFLQLDVRSAVVKNSAVA